MLRIAKDTTDEIAVLSLKGKLMSTSESDKLRAQIHELKEEGYVNVVLDLGDLYLINSEGMGAMLACFKSLQAAQGELKLANLSQKATNVLVLISRLSGVFKIYDTAGEAVIGFEDPVLMA